MIILFQVIAMALVLIIAFLRPQIGYKWSCAALQGVGWLAGRPGVSVAVIGLLALLSSAAVSLLVHIPQPRYHDEFSYLMAADTFANGRLTNPTHPMWVHFETFHVIHQPTYQSKYPPGQGLMLAAGQVIGGHPIVGVWISIGLMSAAICWMLQAWLPSRWALLGGLLVILHAGILLNWGQSYWGGAVAAIGGALVFGALRRIVLRPSVANGLIMGVGLAILVNSRPFEGLVVSVPVAVMLVWWMFSNNGPHFRVSMTRIVLPIFVILIATAGWIGYYNFRVTGDALRMPYQLYEATYATIPVFLWQDTWPERNYRHKVMHDHYVDREGLIGATQLRSVSGFIEKTVAWVQRLWKFYLGVVLTVPLIMLPWVIRDKWMRFALLICGLLIVAFVNYNWVLPYYAAPITGLIFVIVLQAMRHLHLWRWHGRPAGRLIVQVIPVICIISIVLSLAEKIRKPEHEWSLQRARILEQLMKDGRRHLIVVRYGSKYSWRQGEWVHNRADIDNAKVVWARQMDTAQNRKLLEHFKDRQAWLLEVNGNDSPAKLIRYPSGSRVVIQLSQRESRISAPSVNENCC